MHTFLFASTSLSEQPKPKPAVYAVIDIAPQDSFKPKNSDSVPSEGFAGFPVHLTCKYATLYNADGHSVQNRRWACVSMNGVLVFISNVDLTIRPGAPTAFPPGAETGLTMEQAKAIQDQRNNERLKIARVPRQWTLALRPLIAVEGGAQ